MRHVLIIVILLVIGLSLVFFFSSEQTFSSIEPIIEPVPPVRIGVIPYVQPALLRTYMSPVIEYLQMVIKRPVRLVVASDYESLGHLLLMKKIEMGWFSHTSYTRLKGDNPWKILCRPQREGKLFYRGRIIVRDNSPFKKIEDLRGKTFAYVDRFSGSGFYFPNLLS